MLINVKLNKSIVERFGDYLINIEYPDKQASWNIKGTLKQNSNQTFKFDVRDMNLREDGLFQKNLNTTSKAEKIVFETTKQWVILDAEELIKYVLKNKGRVFHIDNLIKELDWNIYVNKSL